MIVTGTTQCLFEMRVGRGFDMKINVWFERFSLINSEVFQSFNIFFLLINGLESFPIKITKSPKNIFHGVVFQPNYIKLLHSVDMYSTNSMNCKRKDMYVYSSRCFMSFILLHSVSYLGSYHPSTLSSSWFYIEL